MPGSEILPEEVASERARIARERLYLVVGQDAERREEAIAAVTQVLRADGVQVESVDGERLSAAELDSMLSTGSLFARDRIVVVRRADSLAGGQSTLPDWIERLPAAGVRLLLSVERLPVRRHVPRGDGAGGLLVRCEPLKGRELLDWTRRHAGRLGVKLSPPALGALVELCGGRSDRLKRELEKLACYPAGGEVDEEVVRRLVPPEEEGVEDRAVFQLADAIARGQAAQALGLLAALLGTGRPLLSILPTLDWFFRQVAVVAHSGHRADLDQLAAQLGMGSQKGRWQLEKRRPTARRYSPAALVRCFDALVQAERLVKGSSLPEEWIGERLVLALLPEGFALPGGRWAGGSF